MKVDLERLHRIHASQAVGVGGNSFTIEPIRWRGEGDGSVKREMARRIVLCWNVCEGWPTDALEAGCLRDYDAAAMNLISVVERYPTDDLPANLVNAVGHLRIALRNRDMQQDLTNGRPHDCESCMEKKDA
jgi:hypothetical protein